MQLTFLGTGTSQGVPVIGCPCEVCRSTDTRDQRLRTSVLIGAGERHVVIDIGPDFRQQMLMARPPTVDAILLTHEHNDHVAGLDDVRPYNFMQRRDMPVYCTEAVARSLRSRFDYVFSREPYPGAPMIRIEIIEAREPFRAGGLDFYPIPLLHGRLPVLGFRIGDTAYLTDIKTIAPVELASLRGIDTLILGVLQRKEHSSHLNLSEALDLISRIEPRQTWLTHLSHNIGLHAELQAELPPHIQPAYDGLTIEVV